MSLRHILGLAACVSINWILPAIAAAKSWNTTEGYPERALKQGEHGTTIIDLTVSLDGKPTKCEVLRSSRSAELDAETCASSMQRAKFDPVSPESIGRNGRHSQLWVHWIMPRAQPTDADLPLVGVIQIRVIEVSQTRLEFPAKPAGLPQRPLSELTSPIEGLKYPKAARRYELSGVTSVAVEVDADGTPRKYNIIRTSGYPVLDDAVCPHMLQQMRYQPAISKDGQFVADVDIISVNWKFVR